MATEKTEALESKPTILLVTELALKTILNAPKGTYATGHFIDNEIPVCSHCGDKESNTCSEGYSTEICPMLRVKPKNTL